MGWLTAIKNFLNVLPKLVGAFQAIGAMYEAWKTNRRVKKKLKEADAAIKDPKRSNAARRLNDLFRRKL